MVSTDFLESKELISDWVIVSGCEEGKLVLLFQQITVQEVWKGDTDGLTELMVSIFFDT